MVDPSQGKAGCLGMTLQTGSLVLALAFLALVPLLYYVAVLAIVPAAAMVALSLLAGLSEVTSRKTVLGLGWVSQASLVVATVLAVLAVASLLSSQLGHLAYSARFRELTIAAWTVFILVALTLAFERDPRFWPSWTGGVLVAGGVAASVLAVSWTREPNALSNAAAWGNLPGVELLVAIGVDPRSVDEFGQTALFGAAASHSPRLTRFLLGRGVDPNHLDGANATALDYALEQNDLELAQILLDGGARFDSNVFYRAVRDRDPKGIDWLVAHGADMGRSDALQTAVQMEDVPWLRTLLDRKLDLSGSNAVAATCEMRSSRAEALALLLEKGANPNIPNSRGVTALQCTSDPALARLLLEHRADPDVRDPEGRTTLLRVIENADWGDHQPDRGTLIDLLLEHGADPNARNLSGDTPTSLAICGNGMSTPPRAEERLKLVRMLLQRGGDPRHHNASFPPLECAAQSGDVPLAVELLAHGVGVEDGEPLLAAASYGKLEMASFLLDRGADPNHAQRGTGKTAVALATEAHHPEIADLLRRRGALR